MSRDTHRRLVERHRAQGRGAGDALSLKVHRALSWHGRALEEADDPDARFIFLWIAFNAAYARDFSGRLTLTERRQLVEFLKLLVRVDRMGRLYEAVWSDFAGPYRTLIGNRFVYQPFWDAVRTGAGEEGWRQGFERSRRRALRALGEGDTERVLAVIFDRLYVLRNQLVHGGATWASSVNRQQVCDGAAIMERLVPIIVELMMDHPDRPWGRPCYPVVD